MREEYNELWKEFQAEWDEDFSCTREEFEKAYDVLNGYGEDLPALEPSYADIMFKVEELRRNK